jgi:hypothetical protein
LFEIPDFFKKKRLSGLFHKELILLWGVGVGLLAGP